MQMLAPPSASDPALDPRRARGAALRACRREAGLSARELAEQINARTRGSDVTTDAIYSYENGRVLLSQELAERIAATLEVRAAVLLEPAAGAATGASPTTPAAPATAPAPEALAAARADGEALGRVLMVREILLSRARAVQRSVEMYADQLSAFHAHVLTREGLTGAETMLRVALRAQTEAPEAGWLGQQAPDARHEPLQELLGAMTALLRDLPGPGAPPLSDADLAARLNTLKDRLGRVDKMVAGAPDG